MIQFLGDGVNTADGGAGIDYLSVSGFLRSSGMTVDLTSLWTTGSGTVNGSSYTGFEAVTSARGSEFDDYINLGGSATTADVHIGDSIDAGGGQGGNDTIIGTDGANYISGNEGNDTLSGYGGIDHLSGGNGNDALDGGAGTDTLAGGAGNDGLDGGAGADAMAGGLGDDSYEVDDGGDTVIETAGEGIDTVFSYISGWTLSDNVENLTAGSRGDAGGMVLTGNALGNTITGLGYQPISGNFATDTLNGLGGDDRLYGLAGDDVLNGGGSDDLLFGGGAESWGRATSDERDTLDGGAGNDVLDGGDGDDTLRGGTGNDRFCVDSAGDVVIEAAGEGTKDRVITSAGFALGAGAAVEILIHRRCCRHRGDRPDRQRAGQPDHRQCRRQPARRRLGATTCSRAGAGSDVLRGRAGATTSSTAAPGPTPCAATTATMCISSTTPATRWSSSPAKASTGSMLLSISRSATNIENLVLRGAAQNGTGNGRCDNGMIGSSGKNTLSGLAGNDTIDGGTGFDTIDGGDGNDVLTGGIGKDRLTGGAGLDQFVFRDGDSSADRTLADVVVDFSHAQADRLKLNPMDANTTLAGDQKFTFIGAGAFTGVAGPAATLCRTPARPSSKATPTATGWPTSRSGWAG